MGTWNYRVFSQPGESGAVELSIREAYYDCDGEHGGEPCELTHVPHSWTTRGETLIAEDDEELRFKVEGMLRALERPTLVLDASGDKLLAPPASGGASSSR